MRRLFAALLTFACLSVSFTAKAEEAGAKAFVDGLAKQVLAIVQNSAIDKATQTTKIESLFSNKVDINFVAKFALGQYWRQSTDAQRSAYIAAYKPFILKNYANRLTRYSGETYTLKQARQDGDAQMVTMVIHDPQGQDINVDYRLTGSGSNYRIIDIIVEGVSLLTTQRSEFKAVLDQKGVDGLTEILKAKVASQS